MDGVLDRLIELLCSLMEGCMLLLSLARCRECNRAHGVVEVMRLLFAFKAVLSWSIHGGALLQIQIQCYSEDVR